ncbi:MAG: ATP-binding protein [Cocleimonas sp.]|nr:ATP-binding protein [Cocleimonas sp.]
MINSLFLRVYLSALVFSFAVFFLMMFVLNVFIFDTQLINDSKTIQQTIEKGLQHKNPKTWQDEIEIYNALETELTLSLISWDSLSDQERKKLSQAKDHRVISDNTLGQKDLYTLALLKNSKQWVLKIDETDNDGDESTYDWLDLAISFFLIFSSLAFALFLLVRKLTQPIDHLVHVATRLGDGEWDARANNKLLPPMDTLAIGFNHMADELKNIMQEQQILIGAIPHELRSPLARIRFSLDLSRTHTSVDDLRKNIEKIDGYVDEMQLTVDEILELNRLQNQQRVETSSFEICTLLEQLQHQHKIELPEIKLMVECDNPQQVSGNESLIKRAINNVLSNAQCYAKTTIKIVVNQTENQTSITISDDGAGIEEDKRSEVFTPFSTLDNSRNRKTAGIGLGLAIVKLIMKKHGGDVRVNRSKNLGGARFELLW